MDDRHLATLRAEVALASSAASDLPKLIRAGEVDSAAAMIERLGAAVELVRAAERGEPVTAQSERWARARLADVDLDLGDGVPAYELDETLDARYALSAAISSTHEAAH